MTPLTGTGVLRGQVTDAVEGKPLAGAEVQLQDANQVVFARVITDNEGRYELPNLPAGTHVLLVRYTTHARNGFAKQPIAVTDGATQHDVALDTQDRTPIKKPYGAPPARRRVV